MEAQLFLMFIVAVGLIGVPLGNVASTDQHVEENNAFHANTEEFKFKRPRNPFHRGGDGCEKVPPFEPKAGDSTSDSSYDRKKRENTRPRKLRAKIAPSILNADLSRLADETQKLLDWGADYVHLDLMDGVFVPTVTFGHGLVQSLRKNLPHAFFDAHIMVQYPDRWIALMAEAGVQLLTFHVEASTNVTETCLKIREHGMQVGLAVKPKTPVTVVAPYMDLVDMVLVMTVEPGLGGQKFMDDMLPKVKWLRSNYPTLDIQVDGGVGLNTIAQCAEAGANVIVSGTAVVGAKDPKHVISVLRAAVEAVVGK